MKNNNYIDRDVDRDVDIEILDWKKNLQISGLWLAKKTQKLNNQKKERKKKPTWIHLVLEKTEEMSYAEQLF